MALFASLMVLATPAVASAQVFTVNTNADHMVNGCDAADCTLREAVAAAGDNDTVNVPAGDYVLSNLFGGELVVDANMTIVGAGARETIISTSPSAGSRVMRVAPPPTPAPAPVNASVSGVTLTNGIGVGGNGGNGGALHVANLATLTLSDSAVTNSRSNVNGGGIYTEGILTLNRVTVSGNVVSNPQGVGNGGGIYHAGFVEPFEPLTITNSTISGNSADGLTGGNGGGIYSNSAILRLQSTTIAGNTAESNGAGLFKNSNGAVIQDSIIAATTGAACSGSGMPSVSGSNNLDTDGLCLVAASADPQLGALANNGGPTDTRALGATSPAIGAANPANCGGTDQRGIGRPQGGTCDIGAYEYVPTSTQGGGGEQPSPGGEELPPPQAGKTLNALPARGTVTIRRPGSKRFVKLEVGQQIPVGTVIDTLRGRVTLVAAGGQQATFYDGIFKIAQGKGSKPRTTLTLTEKLSCPMAGSAITAARKKKKRRLWGDGSGKFRTKGKHSAATVVGTKWLVDDRCKSTLTRVTRGRVSVRDFVKKKTVTVRAGKKYIARAG